MKKPVLLIAALVVISIAVYFLVFSKSDKTDFSGTALDPIPVSEENAALNEQMQPYFNAYFNLKDALVSSNAEAANDAANKLIEAGKTLNSETSDAEDAIRDNINHYMSVVEVNSRALVQEADLEAKRKEFEVISEAFWNLGQLTRYNAEKVYYQFCPMAFNDKGAYWLSNDREIRNPYFGDKMLKCGSVKDSLSY